MTNCNGEWQLQSCCVLIKYCCMCMFSITGRECMYSMRQLNISRYVTLHSLLPFEFS